MTSEVPEPTDRQILPLRGSRVVGIQWGENVTFELEPTGEIEVGYGAVWTRNAITAPGAEPLTLGELDRNEVQASVGARVVSAVCFISGALRVVFDNGWHLNVRAKGAFVPASVTSGDRISWMRPRQ